MGKLVRAQPEIVCESIKTNGTISPTGVGSKLSMSSLLSR